MNPRMPIMDGITAARLIRQAYAATKVLLVTVGATAEHLAQAEHAGAAGYVFKEASQAELLTAIHQVLSGKRLFD
jgi:two-component system response regulator DesR